MFDPCNLAVGAYVPLWLDSIREAIGPRAWKRHEEITRLHIVPVLGKTKLGKLNALQVQALYRKKLDARLSLTTVRKIHATLYKSLKQALRWQLVPRNVCESVTPPRAARVEIEALTQEEVKVLLDAARSDRLYALYVLACTTKRLKDVMIRCKKLGYGGFAMGMIYGKLRSRYPKAHEAFEEELRG